MSTSICTQTSAHTHTHTRVEGLYIHARVHEHLSFRESISTCCISTCSSFRESTRLQPVCLSFRGCALLQPGTQISNNSMHITAPAPASGQRTSSKPSAAASRTAATSRPTKKISSPHHALEIVCCVYVRMCVYARSYA